MTLRVAINGFGRIGRNFMRCWLSRGANTNIEVVGINVTSDPKTCAHLLKYDSILGAINNAEISHTDDTFQINGKLEARIEKSCKNGAIFAWFFIEKASKV